VRNPSILGSSLGAFEATASRKDHIGFNINISANSSFHQQSGKKQKGPIKAKPLNSSYHRIIPKQAATI
jgi:hypothetical protein